MNHSIHSADKATHLKIVVVALVAGILVAGFGISARTNTDYPDRPRREGRQAGGRDQLGRLEGAVTAHSTSANENGRLRAAFLLTQFQAEHGQEGNCNCLD